MMQPYVHTHSYIIGTNPRPLSRTISLSMQATCDEVNEKVQLRIERKKAKKALKLVMNIYTFAIHKFPKWRLYIYLSFDQFYVEIQSPGSTVFLIYRMVFEYAEQSRWWKHCTLAPACAGNTGKEGKRWLWWFRQGFSVWLWLWQQPRVWWWKWGWRGGHPSSSSVGPSPSHRISAQGRSSWCWQGRAQGTPPEHWAQLGTTLPQSSLIYPNDKTILNVYIEIDHLSKFDLFQLCICVLNSKGIIMWWTSQYVYQGQTKAAESMVDVGNINLEDARKRLAE